MRVLADRLGSGTATLYRHLAGKDELMVYVVDRILGEVDVETDADTLTSTTWQEATARGAAPGLRRLRERRFDFVVATVFGG